MNNGVYYLEEERDEVVVEDESWARRRKLYEEHWARCQLRIDNKRAELNNSVLNTLLSYQRQAQLLYEQTQEQVLTCILNMGSDIASRSQFFMQYEQRVRMREDVQLIRLNSEQVGTSDLKAVCRVIVRACCMDEDEDEDPIRLGREYDMERVLKVGRKLFITIEDAEKWSVDLLDTLVAILRLYAVQLGIVLTMGVCAPLQHFQDELLFTTIANLNFKTFDTRSSYSVEEVLDAIVFHEDTIQAVGPNLLRHLMRSYRDRMENIEEFIAGFRYAFMLHCYADQAALLTLSRLDPSLLNSTTDEELVALRRQHSVQKYFDQLVEQKRTAIAWPLVNNDDAFRLALPDLASKVLDYHALLNIGLHLLHALINFVKTSGTSHTQKWILYCKALEGTLVNDPMVRGAVQKLATFPPNRLASFLTDAMDKLPTTSAARTRLLEMHHRIANLKVSDERDGLIYVDMRPKIVDYIKQIIGCIYILRAMSANILHRSLQPPDAVPFSESFYFDYSNMHEKVPQIIHLNVLNFQRCSLLLYNQHFLKRGVTRHFI